MSKIKELFGVEVEEKFDIDSNGGGTIKNCFFDRTGALVVPNFDYLDVDTLILLTALISGEAKIEKAKKPILNDVEKKFIGNIIKPFMKQGYRIEVFHVTSGNIEWLAINMDKNNITTSLSFPKFKAGTKYKGMTKVNEPYTPEKLGL